MNDDLKLTDQEKVEHVARMVRALLVEHEIAGAFFLAAPTHCAEALMIDPAPWMRVQLQVDETTGELMGMRMRAKLDEYIARGFIESDALAERKRDVETTISALSFFATHMGSFALLSLDLYQRACRRFDVETTSERVGGAWGQKPN